MPGSAIHDAATAEPATSGAYFAVDEDGDINLLANATSDELSFEVFASTLDLLTHYAETMARDLGRVSREVGYQSTFLRTQ
ncbi:MAG: hypothetical protein HC802_06550 [Caldilineaceae bacterium]|nr:hypothetical protein [Caldilineaceae bacterium]